MARLPSFLLLAAAVALPACRSSAPEPERSSPDAAVVWVHVTTADGEEGRCTGVVVAPHLVLTAAHCLSLQAVGRHPSFELSLDLGLGGDSDNPVRATHRVAVAATTWDPAFDANVLPRGHDVGLVMARTPLGVAPPAVNRKPLPLGIEVGRLIGYGIASASVAGPEDGEGGEGGEGGVRRTLPVRLRGAGERFIDLDGGQAQPCAGDSGGPVLARLVAGGPEVVVGIVSYGDAGCRRGALVTNIATYADYLRDFLARDAIPATAH